MEITTRQNGDVTILDLKGKLVRGVGDEALREAMDRLLGERRPKVLINLSDVSFVDSSGIGELVASKKVADQLGLRAATRCLRNMPRPAGATSRSR